MKPPACDSEKVGSSDIPPMSEQWLNQIQPLIMIGRITPEVIHDINNQLTGILGYAELLSMKKIEDESIKNGLKTIYLSAEKCKEILANLLSFARQETAGISLADVNEVVEKTIELRSCALRHRQIEIVKRLEPDIPVLPVDTVQLQKVFMVLVFAVEESLKDCSQGKIIFKTAFNPEDRAVVIRISAGGVKHFPDRILRFFSSGQEIESLNPETMFRLDKVRQSVAAWGGTLEMNGEEGPTFIIYLPIKG
jgi:light-regulated signal transduction histidine kinase (bacteriophytochrome)